MVAMAACQQHFLCGGHIAYSFTRNQGLGTSFSLNSVRTDSWRSQSGFISKTSPPKTPICKATASFQCNSDGSFPAVSLPSHNVLPVVAQKEERNRGGNMGGRPQAVLEASQPTAEGQLAVSWVTVQGRREEMEDELIVVEDAPFGFVFAGVFDGHAGHSASQFLKQELYAECLAALDGGQALEKDFEEETISSLQESLTQAFLRTDSRLLAFQEGLEGAMEQDAGSTASAMFVRKDRIVLAHAGDSRAVLCRAGETQDLCEDHRLGGDSQMALAEVERITKAGGWVKGGRVCGFLAVSRAFGNSMYKTRRKEMLLQGIKKGRWTTRFASKMRTDTEWITPLPDVKCLEVPDDAEFVMLASDGLWDAVKSSEAARFLRVKLKEHGDMQRACDSLVQFALTERKGDDNITLIVIQLQPSLST